MNTELDIAIQREDAGKGKHMLRFAGRDVSKCYNSGANRRSSERKASNATPGGQ